MMQSGCRVQGCLCGTQSNDPGSLWSLLLAPHIWSCLGATPPIGLQTSTRCMKAGSGLASGSFLPTCKIRRWKIIVGTPEVCSLCTGPREREERIWDLRKRFKSGMLKGENGSGSIHSLQSPPSRVSRRTATAHVGCYSTTLGRGPCAGTVSGTWPCTCTPPGWSALQCKGGRPWKRTSAPCRSTPRSTWESYPAWLVPASIGPVMTRRAR
mmetsp:Transcript_106615/g.183827  ORF Transcript_106615/g.183827 Transcript_106615/m.183827 type:complete len:211 (+) Transcript_106615:802-1434(+)